MVQVTHPPFTALDSNPTDPLLACTMGEAVIAVKTQPGNQEKNLHEFPASRPAPDLHAPAIKDKEKPPASLTHPNTAGAPSLEPTSSPAQVIQLGRSRGL